MPVLLRKYPIWQFFLLHVQLVLNKDVSMLENYDTYAMQRLEFLVAGCQLMCESVTVGSLVRDDMM